MSKCKYKQCDKYYYDNGICLNRENIDRHMKECNDNERCEHEAVQMVQDGDRQESKDV